MSYYLTAAQKALATPGPCLRCGKEVKAPYERNSAGRCIDCHNLEYQESKAKRKQSLAAMPRCEACNRRGAWVSLGVYLCSHHLQLVEGKLAGRMGIFSLVAQITAQDIRAVLQEVA